MAARYPAEGHPPNKPAWRVLVHRKHLDDWGRIAEVCGEANARELWEHLSGRPDRPPRLGTVTAMKGKHHGAKDGMSRVYHYEITGAGRVDYRFNPNYVTNPDGDPHCVVQVISIDLGSH